MRKGTLLLVLAITLPACRKEPITVDNLLGGRVIVQGHGGMGIHSLYPLNSPASVLACLNSGADGVEIDVQMSRDSVLVAYHSADLAANTDITGAVASRTWAELEAARFTSSSYNAYRLFRLDHFMDQLGDPGRFHWSLDLKSHPADEPEGAYLDRFARAVARLVGERGLADRCHIESHQTYLLLAIRGHLPGARLFIYPTDFAQGFAEATAHDLTGISTDMAWITREQVVLAHDSGLWIALWNVSGRSENTEAMRLGPEIIQSDRVEHLLGLQE